LDYVKQGVLNSFQNDKFFELKKAALSGFFFNKINLLTM
jgi:hypothetical protein